MVETLYSVLGHLGYERILGIRRQAHIYKAGGIFNNKYKAVSFDIEALWQDYKAIPENQEFMLLPAKPIRKKINVIRTSKRSLYKKRYEWLQQMNHDVDECMQRITGKREQDTPTAASFPRAA